MAQLVCNSSGWSDPQRSGLSPAPHPAQVLLLWVNQLVAAKGPPSDDTPYFLSFSSAVPGNPRNSLFFWLEGNQDEFQYFLSRPPPSPSCLYLQISGFPNPNPLMDGGQLPNTSGTKGVQNRSQTSRCWGDPANGSCTVSWAASWLVEACLPPPLIFAAFLLRIGSEGETHAGGLGQTFGNACLAKPQPRKEI